VDEATLLTARLLQVSESGRRSLCISPRRARANRRRSLAFDEVVLVVSDCAAGCASVVAGGRRPWDEPWRTCDDDDDDAKGFAWTSCREKKRREELAADGQTLGVARVRLFGESSARITVTVTADGQTLGGARVWMSSVVFQRAKLERGTKRSLLTVMAHGRAADGQTLGGARVWTSSAVDFTFYRAEQERRCSRRANVDWGRQGDQVRGGAAPVRAASRRLRLL
jgi:hypothetical protein